MIINLVSPNSQVVTSYLNLDTVDLFVIIELSVLYTIEHN